jgi:hypothetical protein
MAPVRVPIAVLAKPPPAILPHGIMTSPIRNYTASLERIGSLLIDSVIQEYDNSRVQINATAPRGLRPPAAAAGRPQETLDRIFGASPVFWLLIGAFTHVTTPRGEHGLSTKWEKTFCEASGKKIKHV